MRIRSVSSPLARCSCSCDDSAVLNDESLSLLATEDDSQAAGASSPSKQANAATL
jgi:hypothetical protein